MDYKDKIQKLLNLAESPNPHEAKAALLKAQKLMADHKLGSVSVSNTKEVKHHVTDITCTKTNCPWIMALAKVIGENYCCKSYVKRKKGSRTYTTAFIGFKDDLGICIQIFQYAVDCIQAKIKEIKKKNKGRFDSTYLRNVCDSYGYGFVEGIQDALSSQAASEEGWGLVLVVPKEVETEFANMVTGRTKTKISLSETAHKKGYEKGKKFQQVRRIKE